jgi:XTP/dITP diphosphohydrolase
MSRRWVLASSNAGKLREFSHALAPVLAQGSIALVNQSDLGVSSADEPYLTFEENALTKARHASRATGLPAMADDSGITVSALLDRPGVRSARYWPDAIAALEPAATIALPRLSSLSTDEANLLWLLEELSRAKEGRYPEQQAPDDFYAAAFHAAIAFVHTAEDPEPIIVTGVWPGRVIATPRGSHGFGYDPIFLDLESGLTAAEMTIPQKQAVSHRGRALRLLLARLREADVL